MTTASPEVAPEVAFRRSLNSLLDAHMPGVSKRVDALAAAVGTDKTRIYAWMRGEGLPRVPVLLTIARHYRVTTDRLLGYAPGMVDGESMARCTRAWNNEEYDR
jgi:transcriptional regulator with XRE-family HTH domain